MPTDVTEPLEFSSSYNFNEGLISAYQSFHFLFHRDVGSVGRLVVDGNNAFQRPKFYFPDSGSESMIRIRKVLWISPQAEANSFSLSY